ncbi:RNA helicase [Pleosporales sp. CAS-2024a]
MQTAHRSSQRPKRGLPSRRAGLYNPLSSPNPFRHAPQVQRGDQLARTVSAQLKALKAEFQQPDFLASLQLDEQRFAVAWHSFERSVGQWCADPTPELQKLGHEASRRRPTLEKRLRHLFYDQTCGARFTRAELDNQKDVANLRYPAEWYPATRQLPRTVHLHVGPTNSGKTYHALKRLEQADSGIYLGPLRLLAHEVYTRLNACGKPCALVTGEEQRMPTDGPASMFSCTVEMAPLNTRFDVAVIDEIQMISHKDRGWAWTQAFLGLQAREIHLCGEARTVPIMRELAALVGDKVHVHEYDRLTPLQVEPQCLNRNLKSLQKGDCIVAFTIVGIHALRREIEETTGRKCAIVYGTLPPETRAQQARLFNDPDNDYDFLVASDAIGMGLNLAVRRIIFESTIKSNGVDFVPLEISEIKQIAGRAGRYKTAHQAVVDSTQTSIADRPADPAIGLDDKSGTTKTVGWVTTLEKVDYTYLKKCMEREPTPIATAGIFPPSVIIERFANYFPPGTPFSFIMRRLHEILEIHPRFHLCALKDQISIADVIHLVRNLSIQDRITLCSAPINTRNKAEKVFFLSLADCIASGKSGSLLDIPTLPLAAMDKPASGKRKHLVELENLHKMLVCYLWLSYRFPNVFITRSLAKYAKKLVEDQIEQTLNNSSVTEQARNQLKKRREKARLDLDKPRTEDLGEQAQGPILPRPGMPGEAKDMMKHAQVLGENSTTTTDVDAYPEEPLTNKVLDAPPSNASRSAMSCRM